MAILFNIHSKRIENGVNGKQKPVPEVCTDQDAVKSMNCIESNNTSATPRPQSPPLVAVTPVAEPDVVHTMEAEAIVEIQVQTNQTMETDHMSSINEMITSTDAMSIDASGSSNVTESTAEMVSVTSVPAADSHDDSDAKTAHELAFITHVDHPNRFYMQLNSDTDALNVLHESLQIVAPQLPALSEFRVGELCIGKFSLDDCWYRARIMDTDGEITSIQFIDFGNTDSITDNALLKTPDPTLMKQKPFAMPCSLPIAPHGNTTEWAENACEKLRLLSIDTPFEYHTISNDNGVNYVKIFLVGGRDLVHEMIQEEVADPLEIIKSGEQCYVSHINSLTDFYIQVESDTEVLHKIEMHLAQNCDASVTEAVVGQICSAQFVDGQFYRARIMDIVPATQHYLVEFLDYGNTCLTAEIRALNPQVAQLPHLRKRCQLQLPNNVQGWSEKAEEQFRVMSGDGANAFTVHLMKPGKAACVELYTDADVNLLSHVLAEYCEKRPHSPTNTVVDESELAAGVSHDQVAVSMLSDIMEEATTMSYE